MPTAPTAEQVAFAIATTPVGKPDTALVNGTAVEYRRHAPDRYEMRLTYTPPFLSATVEHTKAGWRLHVGVALGADSNDFAGFLTAQEAIEDGLRYLMVLDRIDLDTMSLDGTAV